MKKGFLDKHTGQAAAALSFLTAWGFFQLAYPCHLMRREQLNLFLFDWDYILETYRGTGWLARLAGDFTDQFLCFPVIGPMLIAVILTGIAASAYRICRHFTGRWPSLGIAALFFIWSLLRETDNIYLTQYSIATLAYLALILGALQFKRVWMKSLACVAAFAAGIFIIGSPFNNLYGKPIGKPNFLNEKLIALDIQASQGRWDKVLKLSEDDLRLNTASYFYNLASAEKGLMGENFFDHSQSPLASSLLIWINPNDSQFSSGAAGEVWFRLGNMTLAEQSTVVSLQVSPKHTGARFITRLAEITLISGEYASAQKYLNMLSKTLAYRRWAGERMPDNMSEETRKWLEDTRKNLLSVDFVFDNNLAFRNILKGLVQSNPDNMAARQYLLMYDLLYLHLDDFIEDYSERMIPGYIWQQAVLVWLGQNGKSSEEECKKYGVSLQTVRKMETFFRYPDRYRNTYWDYVMKMTSKQQ